MRNDNIAANLLCVSECLFDDFGSPRATILLLLLFKELLIKVCVWKTFFLIIVILLLEDC